MSQIGIFAPIVIAAMVLALRFAISRRSHARPTRRSSGAGARIFRFMPLVFPLVMIAVATTAGAFSSLDTALGIALAPFTLGIGVALGILLGPVRANQPGNPKYGDRYSTWIFVG